MKLFQALSLFSVTAFSATGAVVTLPLFTQAVAAPAPQSTPVPIVIPTPLPTPVPPPPRSQLYVRVTPGVKIIEGRTLVPATFLKNTIGAALTLNGKNKWNIGYFGHTVEVTLGQKSALIDGKSVTLPVAPLIRENHLYVPWVPLAELFNIRWHRPKSQPANGGTLLLLQYQAAYIEDIRHSISKDKVRIVMDLSNPTRFSTQYSSGGVKVLLNAARKAGIPSNKTIGDYLVSRVTTTSGNWKAQTTVRLNYAAPASWFTMDNPARIVIDIPKLFEKAQAQSIGSGLTVTKIFRGTGHGPVRIFMARVDPSKGWRLRVAPGSYGVLGRNSTSRIARTHKAPLAINGGFFAFDGAAVGAVKANGEWIRLPWRGRTAIGLGKNGKAKIGNLQVNAEVTFSSGLKLPIRDLNGWPDRNRITAITRRFGPKIQLRAGEIAAVVDNGIVTSTPGSGIVNVPAKGFVLIANGGAIPELQKARRGLKATLKISSPAWDAYGSALGGGPRLVTNGEIDVREEGFRTDVTNGLGPRTAIGINKQGHYILVVADGRQGYYSTGLTLTELAYTMQKFGAVDALNLDGGGSTTMVVKNKVINRPSDGRERGVSNAVLVMR